MSSLHQMVFDQPTSNYEDFLLQQKRISPEDVLKLPHFTKNFLHTSNKVTYDIDFTKFTIRDMLSGIVMFEIKKPKESRNNKLKIGGNPGKYVHYEFSPAFLHMENVGVGIEFTVGNNEIKNFRMIEHHYFKEKLLRTFDFEFGFCIPNSCNTCEHIYQIPKLPPKLLEDIINNPFETKSDAFYFADGTLIMHNKADYSYNNKCK